MENKENQSSSQNKMVNDSQTKITEFDCQSDLDFNHVI